LCGKEFTPEDEEEYCDECYIPKEIVPTDEELEAENNIYNKLKDGK